MNAQQLRNSILQEAIEGRLVPQDPNDEPASVLLDRIREEKKRLVKEGKLKKSALKEIPFSEEGRPFRIPDSWEWCKLGWIGDWGAGATPAKGNSEYYDNGTIPWLRTGELNNGFVYDSEIKVTTKALEKCSLRMCEIGDVLIAMYGATIGKVAIAGIQLTTNQACCACTPHIVYNKYLMYYLMASKKTFIEMGEGGAQPNISREKIVDFPFPLPPLAEQKRIVAKIEELLPKVEEYGKAQEALDKLNNELPERLKKSILQEAIEGRLVPQDPNDEPASVLLERIREEKKRLFKAGLLKKKEITDRVINENEVPFSLPDGWLWTKIDNVAFVTKLAGFEYSKYIADNLVSKEKGVPLFKGKNVQNGKIVYEFEAFIPIELSNELKRSQINKKCLLTPYVGTIGNIGIHDKKGIFHLGSNVGKIEFYNGDSMNILEEYVKYYLMSSYGYDELTKYKKATAQESISIEAIRDVFIPLPPLAEQKRIVTKIEELFAEIDKLKA